MGLSWLLGSCSCSHAGFITTMAMRCVRYVDPRIHAAGCKSTLCSHYNDGHEVRGLRWFEFKIPRGFNLFWAQMLKPQPAKRVIDRVVVVVCSRNRGHTTAVPDKPTLIDAFAILSVGIRVGNAAVLALHHLLVLRFSFLTFAIIHSLILAAHDALENFFDA